MEEWVHLDSPEATVEAGRRLAAAVRASGGGAVIYLRGDLGAGKTTFARGFLDGCGHRGRVPSPTYTLVEPYELDGGSVYHVDLYRLTDASEVDELGLVELEGSEVVLLVEWPERGAGRLQPPDLDLTFDVRDAGRGLRQTALTPAGERILGHKKG